MVGDLTTCSSLRRNYCMDSNIPLIHCSHSTLVHVQVDSIAKIHPAYRNDANEIKPGSNSKMTDKHAAEYSSFNAYIHYLKVPERSDHKQLRKSGNTIFSIQSLWGYFRLLKDYQIRSSYMKQLERET